jgi:hypothetical protein
VTRHFLVIGAQRSGTTYLHDQLEAHPEIAMARPPRPEPKVFLSDDIVEQGAEHYRHTWFAHAGADQLLGEKSTSYIESDTAPARVRATLGDVQIVAQLRDPVERAVSNWKFSSSNGMEQRPLADALRDNLAGAFPWDAARTSVSPYAYLERGRYAAQLAPWLAEFPEQVHVQLLEDLVADPSLIGALYSWLGVDAGFRPSALGEPVHESDVPVDDLPDDLRAELRDYYDQADDDLAELLGRELPWRVAAGTTSGDR